MGESVGPVRPCENGNSGSEQGRRAGESKQSRRVRPGRANAVQVGPDNLTPKSSAVRLRICCVALHPPSLNCTSWVARPIWREPVQESCHVGTSLCAIIQSFLSFLVMTLQAKKKRTKEAKEPLQIGSARCATNLFGIE